MRTTCIITNYNYGAYLPQAIDSVLAQATPFDEIIVVDDGSSDNSLLILSELTKRFDVLKVLRNERNCGQLAAFEAGMMESSGDIVFFLDADDVYFPNYLSLAREVYQKIPECDFLFCRYERFSHGSLPTAFFHRGGNELRPDITDLGLTVVRTLERKAFVGAPTSCLSLRVKLARRLFPMEPVHEDWRTRADDCLVFGASLAGARKFRIEASLVGYRIHDQNAFAGNPEVANPKVFFLRQVALIRLCNFLMHRLMLGADVRKFAHLEFKTVLDPDWRDLREYLGYTLKYGAHDAGRLRGIAVILKWYFGQRVQLLNRQAKILGFEDQKRSVVRDE